MELKCTNCGDNIDAALANIQTDLIQCPTCNAIHQLSMLVEPAPIPFARNAAPTFHSKASPPSRRNEYDLPVATPLIGSKIESYSTRSGLEIKIPSGSLQGPDYFIVIFSVFWLGFVAFWTIMAGVMFPPMALFSIPFWLVGIAMAKGLVGKLTETQTIYLDKYSLTITKKGLLTSNTVQLDIHEITSIKEKKVSWKNQFSQIGKSNSKGKNSPTTLPTVSVGVKDITIFDYTLDSEKEWGMKLLNDMLAYFKENGIR